MEHLDEKFCRIATPYPLANQTVSKREEIFPKCLTANPRNPKTAVIFTLSCKTYVYVCATVHPCTKTSYPTHNTKTTRVCNPKRARMHEQWRVLVMSSRWGCGGWSSSQGSGSSLGDHCASLPRQTFDEPWSPLLCNLCATLSVCSRFLAHCVVMCFPTCPLKWLLSLVIRPHFGHCCRAPCARLPDLWGFNLCPCWALRFACVVKGWGVLPIWPAAQFERGFNWEGSAWGDKRWG